MRKKSSGEERDRKSPTLLISAVSRICEIHPQTLRLYEREGFVNPRRSEGNTRLYSEDDVERIQMILRLTRELRVNMAGVGVILNMRRKIKSMQKQFIELLGDLKNNLEQDFPGMSEKFDELLTENWENIFSYEDGKKAE